MKQIYIIFMFIIPGVLIAQPVIKNTEDFALWTKLNFQKCNGINIKPGPGGANITWDFSNLSPLADSVTEWMVPPSVTSKASLFPSANLVEKYSDGRFVYAYNSGAANYLVGFFDTTTGL